MPTWLRFPFFFFFFPFSPLLIFFKLNLNVLRNVISVDMLLSCIIRMVPVTCQKWFVVAVSQFRWKEARKFSVIASIQLLSSFGSRMDKCASYLQAKNDRSSNLICCFLFNQLKLGDTKQNLWFSLSSDFYWHWKGTEQGKQLVLWTTIFVHNESPIENFNNTLHRKFT